MSELASTIEGRLLKPSEVAALCAISERTLYRKVRAGTFPIPHRDLAGVIRFPAKVVHAYIDGDDLRNLAA